MKINKDILETIGNTPLVDVSNISPNDVKIFAKMESKNPAGSIKDRVAKYLIESAESNNSIKKGGTIIEPTSGCDCYFGNSCSREKRCMNDISVQDVLSNIVLLNKNLKKQ